MPRRARKPEKKPIDQYNHKEASRANNPPVGLINPGDRQRHEREDVSPPTYLPKLDEMIGQVARSKI
jgi:hypothetical protein